MEIEPCHCKVRGLVQTELPLSWPMPGWFIEECMIPSDCPLEGRGGIWFPTNEKRTNCSNKREPHSIPLRSRRKYFVTLCVSNLTFCVKTGEKQIANGTTEIHFLFNFGKYSKSFAWQLLGHLGFLYNFWLYLASWQETEAQSEMLRCWQASPPAEKCGGRRVTVLDCSVLLDC